MLTLPQRQGKKPQTNYAQPHQQLDQIPPPEVYAKLKDQAFDFEFVERRPSVISVPGTEALWLLEEGGHSCAEAFMRGNEFAHVHPPSDGSMHMMLPETDVAELLERGPHSRRRIRRLVEGKELYDNRLRAGGRRRVKPWRRPPGSISRIVKGRVRICKRRQ